MRGAVHKAERRIGVADRSGLEGHRVLMRKPAGELRFELLAQIWTYVQVADGGTAAQPFKNSATGKIGIESLHIDRDGAERLESVEHDIGSDSVGLFDDCFCVLNEGAAKDHVRDRNQQGLFVDGVEQSFSWDRDP